jgi:hypothetical protein
MSHDENGRSARQPGPIPTPGPIHLRSISSSWPPEILTSHPRWAISNRKIGRCNTTAQFVPLAKTLMSLEFRSDVFLAKDRRVF